MGKKTWPVIVAIDGVGVSGGGAGVRVAAVGRAVAVAVGSTGDGLVGEPFPPQAVARKTADAIATRGPASRVRDLMDSLPKRLLRCRFPNLAAALIILCLASGCSLGGKQKLDREKARKMIDLHATPVMQRYLREINTKAGLPPDRSFRERTIVVEKVTGLAFEPGEKVAHADYAWHYEKDGHILRSQAEFRLYDDGWRLDEDALVGGILLAEAQH